MRKLKIYLGMTNIDKENGHMKSFEEKMVKVFGDMVEFYKHEQYQTYNPRLLTSCDLMIIFLAPYDQDIWRLSDYEILKGSKIIGKGVASQIEHKGTGRVIFFCEDVFYFSGSVNKVTPYSGNSAIYAKVTLENSLFHNISCELPVTYEDQKILYSKFNDWMGTRFPENTLSLTMQDIKYKASSIKQDINSLFFLL